LSASSFGADAEDGSLGYAIEATELAVLAI
jgi:hypothetical protein